MRRQRMWIIVASCAFVAALAANVALAAFSDTYQTARVGSVIIECSDPDSAACTVTVRRIRPPTPQAIAEAQAAGIEPRPAVEAALVRVGTRANLQSFLSTTSPLP